MEKNFEEVLKDWQFEYDEKKSLTFQFNNIKN